MRLLLTRPVGEAQASMTRLAQLGHSAVVSPVLRIAPLDWALPLETISGVILTSAHAAAFLSQGQWQMLAALPTFCVGARSADAARAAGLAGVRSADGDEAALAQLVQKHLPPGTCLLYLAGRQRTGGLLPLLHAAGFNCLTVETYDSVAAAALAPAALAGLRGAAIDAVLHYSARSAAVFAKLAAAGGVGDAVANVPHYCLSQAVAAQLAPIAPNRIKIAARPDETALFDLLTSGTA